MVRHKIVRSIQTCISCHCCYRTSPALLLMLCRTSSLMNKSDWMMWQGTLFVLPLIATMPHCMTTISIVDQFSPCWQRVRRRGRLVCCSSWLTSQSRLLTSVNWTCPSSCWPACWITSPWQWVVDSSPSLKDLVSWVFYVTVVSWK